MLTFVLCDWNSFYKVNSVLLNLLFFFCPGNLDEAREILMSLEAAVPGLAMVCLRRVSLERRNGQVDKAEDLLREAMESAKNEGDASFYAVKLARHLLKLQKSVSKARTVLLDAIEKDQV